jgi:hypothetical protein
VADPLTSLSFPDYEPDSYGGERLSCGIARGLFVLEFPGVFMSHPSDPNVEAEDAPDIFAATASAVHSLIQHRLLGIEPIGLPSHSPLDSMPANQDNTQFQIDGLLGTGEASTDF